MGKLIYSMLTSLDGYVADDHGQFDWATPDDELHHFVNEHFASIGTFLYGRRMYATMVYWETAHQQPGASAVELEYARIWQGAEKIVYSSSLTELSSARTRIERTFDPNAVRQLKADTSHDLSIDGPELAAHALRAGLVDEIQPIICPAIVGSGNRFYPNDVHLDLDLLNERRFANGVVFLRYAVRSND